jgi:hypothetical protein
MSLCLDHKDDQDRAKHVGIMTLCVNNLVSILVHLLVYCVNCLLMHGHE